MKPEYQRTTITVPTELKERMNRAKSRVNWSAVACDAFEQKLAELGPGIEIETIEEAVVRMKTASSEPEGLGLGCQSGKEAGLRWALNLALPAQLRRIEQFRIRVGEAAWPRLMVTREGARELALCIDPGIGPAKGPGLEPGAGPRRRQRSRRGGDTSGHSNEKEIWRATLDRRPDHPGFFLGFAEGSLEIWRQIKDQF